MSDPVLTDLSVATVDDLCNELRKRFSTVVVLGEGLDSADKKSGFFRCYYGSAAAAYGLVKTLGLAWDTFYAQPNERKLTDQGTS